MWGEGIDILCGREKNDRDENNNQSRKNMCRPRRLEMFFGGGCLFVVMLFIKSSNFPLFFFVSVRVIDFDLDLHHQHQVFFRERVRFVIMMYV